MPPPARSTERELLDRPGLDPDEVRRNLREMAMLNSLPGGIGASLRATLLLLDGAGGDSPTVLDVGAGWGDFARRLSAARDVRVIAADASPQVLAIAARNIGRIKGVTLLEADARAIPLADDAVAVTHASLLVHHLDPADAVTALREMARVARLGVVINDLRRGRLARLLVAAPILAFARSPMTRHDGLLSARRAYTVPELDDLAAAAGLRPLARTPAWWPRVTTTYA